VALATMGRGKGKARKGSAGGGSGRGAGRGTGGGTGRGGGKDLTKVKCWHCHEMGHYAVTCPLKKGKGKDPMVAASAEIGEFAARFQQDFALMTGQLTGGPLSSLWYIDSGASRHMSGVRDMFSELVPRTNQQDIILGDDSVVRVAGIGEVSFQREHGAPLRLTDVLYVPGLRKNLVSVSCIEDKGFVVLFEKGQVYIYPQGGSRADSRVIGVRQGRMYRLVFEAGGALACSTSSSREMCELWHRRLGHLHHGALSQARDFTTGIPEFSIEHDDVCRGCALGKYTKAPFPGSDNRAQGILDLIHTKMSVVG